MMKRFLAALLAACMLTGALAGCKPKAEESAGNTAVPMTAGRYVESEIALPALADGAKQMVIGMQTEAGAISIFTMINLGEAEGWRYRYFRHTIGADGTVTTAEETWLNELAPFGGNEMRVTAAADGTLYMTFSDFDAQNQLVAHILVSRDGGKTGMELAGDGLSDLDSITSFGVLGDGSMAAGSFYSGVLLLLDADGNRVQELTSDNRGPIVTGAANGNFVALAAIEGNVVRVYDCTSKTYQDYAFSFSEQSYPQLAVAGDGAVLLVDNTGVYRHAPNGTLWEKLVDGETSTLGLPNFYAGSVRIDEESAYPAIYIDDVERVLAYRYDPTVTATADKELTVFSLRPNDTVRQAIVAFSRVRSDVKITYTVAMDNASGGTEQDYIKSLNTELIAKTGPDILILDGLPIDSYIEKDVLTDLTAVLAGTEPMQENIRAAFLRDGAIYAVPTGFSVPMAVAAAGTETAFDSLPKLADAAEQAGDVPLLTNCAFSFRTLSLYLIQYYGDALQNGDAAAVEAFLTDAKRISGAIGCTALLGAGWDALGDMSQDELYEMCSGYIGMPQIVMAVGNEARDILMQPMGSVRACMEMTEAAGRLNASIVSVNGQFVPAGMVGVNKAGKETEVAAAFVRMLLSYDAQGGNQYAEQFPVNVQALKEMLAYQNDGVSSGMMLSDGSEFSAEWPAKAWRERIGALIDTLDKPLLTDAALQDMLQAEVTAYLDGSNTLAQATERIGSMLSTYLSE